MAKMRIHTDRLRKGMVISNAVYSSAGLLLVSENTVVTKDVVMLLTRHFIEYVIVETDPPKAAPSVSESEVAEDKPTKQQKEEFKVAIQAAEQNLSSSLKAIVYQDEEINVAGMLDMVNEMLEKAANDNHLCDMLFSMKESKESLYRHSINVSLLGQMLAKWLNFTDEEVELVTVAGLLHDIGIVELPNVDMDADLDYNFFIEVLENRKRRYEKHVVNGYNIIKDKDIDPRIKQAVLTHHERFDQSGFPLKIPIHNINKISRVIAVADTYDILTMEEEGNELMSPLHVLEYLQDLSYNKLDPQILLTFIDKITYRYVHQKVLLSNGKVGNIILLNKYNLPKPLVRVNSAIIDLAEHPDIQIVKFVNDDE